MAGETAWRMGALRYALTVAGFWVMRVPAAALPELVDGQRRLFAEGEVVSVHEPTILQHGKLHVIENAVGRRPPRLGTLGEGTLLMPIHRQVSDRAVLFTASGACEGLTVSYGRLVEAARHDWTYARVLLQGLTAAVESQHWALELGAQAQPLPRLATLLLRIVAECGVGDGDEVLLPGAPDAREMGVLADVSRESVVINLAWLESQGVIRRNEGRLWVSDLKALRDLVAEPARPSGNIAL